MSDNPDHGHAEARTPVPGANSALGKALGEFDQAIEAADDDLFSLLEHSGERDAADSLTLAAKSVTEGRKGAGRPRGSQNRRNVEVFRLYQEGHGHRSPSYVLSLIASTDPVELGKTMAKHVNFGPALEKVIKAAEALLPYELAKKTPDVAAPPPVQRPVMVINNFNGTDHQLGSALGVGRIINNDGETSAKSDT